MSEQEMLDYITRKLRKMGYLHIEIVYGFILGLTGDWKEMKS